MATELPPDVAALLDPLRRHPATTAVITDFDGTLSPIVTDPIDAVPIDGAVESLVALSRRFAVVAVVSGRPVSFLVDRLAPRTGPGGPPDPLRSVRLIGLYGLERAGGGGEVVVEPGVEGWRQVVGEAAFRLRATAPPGIEVELKGLAVTVHWRRSPGAAEWAEAAVEAESARTGLRSHPGRMSVELRPPIGGDKGSVVRSLAAGCRAACFLGDDLGDLPAFAALSELRAAGSLATVSIAAVDAESAPEVAEAADAVVDGPAGALAVLRWLAGEVSGNGGR